jgi:hypothetical protein
LTYGRGIAKGKEKEGRNIGKRLERGVRDSKKENRILDRTKPMDEVSI